MSGSEDHYSLDKGLKSYICYEKIGLLCKGSQIVYKLNIKNM